MNTITLQIDRNLGKYIFTIQDKDTNSCQSIKISNKSYNLLIKKMIDLESSEKLPSKGFLPGRYYKKSCGNDIIYFKCIELLKVGGAQGNVVTIHKNGFSYYAYKYNHHEFELWNEITQETFIEEIQAIYISFIDNVLL